MPKILIVEDEQHLADGLRFNLEAEGHRVEIVNDGEAALERMLGRGNGKKKAAAANGPIEAIILDVMLPGTDGFTVAHKLREAGHFLPILMLTARGRSEDVLRGFESGADDYLPKPFELKILIARLNGLLRRKQWIKDAPPPAAAGTAEKSEKPGSGEADIFTFCGRAFDFARLELRVGKKKYPLTLMEAQLLRYLVSREGLPVSRRAILEDVWELHEDTDTRAIDNFIVRLRKYLEVDPADPRHLVTVRGVGYKFVAEPGS